MLAHGHDIVPIPGTNGRKYLEQKVDALNVHLSEVDLHRVDEVAPRRPRPARATPMR
jgi:aryl-alcohol dehydrogenase-like predicted oxidoreductase